MNTQYLPFCNCKRLELFTLSKYVYEPVVAKIYHPISDTRYFRTLLRQLSIETKQLKFTKSGMAFYTHNSIIIHTNTLNSTLKELQKS